MLRVKVDEVKADLANCIRNERMTYAYGHAESYFTAAKNLLNFVSNLSNLEITFMNDYVDKSIDSMHK